MRKIILCCDETCNGPVHVSNNYNVRKVTNISYITSLLKLKSFNETRHACYNDFGVGTCNSLDHFAGFFTVKHLKYNLKQISRKLLYIFSKGKQIAFLHLLRNSSIKINFKKNAAYYFASEWRMNNKELKLIGASYV